MYICYIEITIKTMEEIKIQARAKVLFYQVKFHLDLETSKFLAIKEYQSIIDYIDTKGNGYYTLSDELRKDTDFYNELINEVQNI